MFKSNRKLGGDRNQCTGCGEYFNSGAAFAKHRIGEFGKDRRCMTVDEMQEKKMVKNNADFWVTAANPMHGKSDSEIDWDEFNEGQCKKHRSSEQYVPT